MTSHGLRSELLLCSPGCGQQPPPASLRGCPHRTRQSSNPGLSGDPAQAPEAPTASPASSSPRPHASWARWRGSRRQRAAGRAGDDCLAAWHSDNLALLIVNYLSCLVRSPRKGDTSKTPPGTCVGCEACGVQLPGIVGHQFCYESQGVWQNINVVTFSQISPLSPDCCLCGLDVREAWARHGSHVDRTEHVREQATRVLQIRTDRRILEFLFYQILIYVRFQFSLYLCWGMVGLLRPAEGHVIIVVTSDPRVKHFAYTQRPLVNCQC